MSGRATYRNGVKVSEHHGAGEWATERVALLLLMPLGLWVASSAFTLVGADYDTVMAWFASPLNAILAAVTAVVFFGFASLAWKVIIEDYIHAPWLEIALQLLVKFAFALAALASVVAIGRIAFTA